MDELVLKAKKKVGNTLFIINKYPDKIMYHQPWLALDKEILSHLKSNKVDYNEQNADKLNNQLIKVIKTCGQI